MHRIRNQSKVRDFFGSVACAERNLSYTQLFDWDGLAGRLHSSSYAPTEDQPNYAPMMAELKRIFDAYQQGGRLAMEYETKIYFGQLKSGG